MKLHENSLRVTQKYYECNKQRQSYTQRKLTAAEMLRCPIVHITWTGSHTEGR